MEAMSSFRIDRQYVSYETAETQPIHAKEPSPGDTSQKSLLVGETVKSSPECIDEYTTELIEKARKEAAQKAGLILSKAKLDAEAIIEKAKRQAEDIICDARDNSESIEKNQRRRAMLKALQS